MHPCCPHCEHEDVDPFPDRGHKRPCPAQVCRLLFDPETES